MGQTFEGSPLADSRLRIGQFHIDGHPLRSSGCPAVAGAIHTGLQHGLIRAEVVGYEDLVTLRGMNEAKAKGKLSLEGKEYPVKDGDIVHVRFSI